MKIMSLTGLLFAAGLHLLMADSADIFDPEKQLEIIYSHPNGLYKIVRPADVNDELSPGYKFKVVNEVANWKLMTLEGRHWTSSLDLNQPLQRAYHAFFLYGHLERVTALPKNERELYEMSEEESELAAERYRKELASASKSLRVNLTDASQGNRPQVVQFRLPLNPEREKTHQIEPALARLDYAFRALQEARQIPAFQSTVGSVPPEKFLPTSSDAFDGFWVSEILSSGSEEPQPIAFHLIHIQGPAAEEYIFTADSQVCGELKSKPMLEPNGALVLHSRRVADGFLGDQSPVRTFHILSSNEKSMQVRSLPSENPDHQRTYIRLTEAGFRKQIDAARKAHQEYIASHVSISRSPKEKAEYQKRIIQSLKEIGEM